MEREIKFRARRIDMDRWVYGQYFTTPLTDENSGTESTSGWFFLTGETRHCIGSNVSAFVVNKATLGQFTGRYDKCDKEIYEGDIVQNLDSGQKMFVIYDTDRTSFCFDEPDRRNRTPLGGLVFAGNYKVIGNIYNNPELLNP